MDDITVGHDRESGSPATAPGSTHRSTLRTATGTLAVVALWSLLAALRPHVTYHLAPALVVWSVPFLQGGRSVGTRALLGATGLGVLAAVTTAIALAFLDWSRGPVLFGGDATIEAVLVAVAAGLLVPAVTMVSTRSSGG